LKSKFCILIFIVSNFTYAQQDSLSIAASNNFIAFIDSVLTKEDPNSKYSISHFSTLQRIQEYPIEITSLAYPTLYNDRDEYYAAFLYREKYFDSNLFVHIDSCVLNTFNKLRSTIKKGILNGKHKDKREQKLINQLIRQLESTLPPTVGYFQTAVITFEYEGISTSTDFQIVYDSRLRVENFGRYVK
jgi:hypothetical protein